MPRYTLLVALLLGVVLLGLPETSGGRRGGRDRRGRARRQKVAEDTEGVASPPPFPSPTPPPAPSPLQAPGGDNTTTVTPLGGQLENATTAAAMLTLSSTTSASVSASASAVAPTEGRSRTAGRQDKHRLLAAEKSHPALSSSSTSQDHVRSDVQIGCKELRSKRYISDGFCTSIKPVTEVVCTGHCLPMTNLPWYAEFIKVWARTKVLEWRCVNDVVKRKRVRLLCENGETRTYRIKVVKSCKCKRYMRQQNQSLATKGRAGNGSHHRRREKEVKKARSNKVPF